MIDKKFFLRHNRGGFNQIFLFFYVNQKPFQILEIHTIRFRHLLNHSQFQTNRRL